MSNTRQYIVTLLMLIAMKSDLVFGQEPNRVALCGPKCVNSVLDFYGLRTFDPIEITEHLDRFDVARGTTLADLAAFLSKEGVYVRVYKIDDNSSLDWKYPVIMHLEVGHFVTLFPSKSKDVVRIFDGVSKVRFVDPASLHADRSGVVMLTAPTPILDDVHFVEPATFASANGFYKATSVCVFVFGAICFAFGLMSRRKG